MGNVVYIKKIIPLLMIMGVVSAYNLELGVYDINSYDGINNATIDIYNISDDFINTTYTNENGLISIELGSSTSDPMTYNLITDKLGYIQQENAVLLSSDTSYTIYLIPISTNGIIRLTGNEITFNNEIRQLRIYYLDNGRFHGSFKLNDTITLLINREYTIRPEFKKADILTGTTTIQSYSIYLVALFGGIVVFGFLIVVILLPIRFIWKKIK